MAAEFEFGGRTYLIGKMGPRDQLHVLRRVMPLLSPILLSLKQAQSGVPFNKIGMMIVMSEDLAKIPDDQLNYVIDTCLSVVEVKTDGKPLKLMVNGRSMFGEMDLPTMIQVMWAVLMENLRPFLSGLLDGPLNVEESTSETSSS